MIKFTCGNCNHKIGAPETYAGKRISCPKCKSPIQVPKAVEKTDSPKRPLIKFRCPSCNQKIGVTAEYAGKRVRCSKCKNPLHVPKLEKEPLEKQLPADHVGPNDMFRDGLLTDELLAAEASAPSVERPLKVKPLSPELSSTQPQSFDNEAYIGGFSQTFGSSATREPSKKKRPVLFIGIMCALALLVVGVVVWYFTADLDTVEGEFGEEQVTLLDDTEDDGTEVALFCITSKNYKKGFIDNTGKIIIKPKFDEAGLISQGFSDGLARVAIGEKGCYIDRKGKTKFFLDPKFHSVAKFSEGLAAVGCVVGDEEKFGYIDKTGELVIETKFSDAGDFSEDLASVQIGGKASGMIGGVYGYIDRNGEYVVEPKFDYGESFSDGLACVLTGGRRGGMFEAFGGKIGGKYGYIDKGGNYAIEPQFKWATSFSEGLALVVIGQKAGFINKSGEIFIEAKFDSALSFSDGLACVTVGDKSGYIDKMGQYVIEPQFKWAAYSFYEGLAAVYDGKKKKFGFIDKTGSFVIEPQFGLPGNFTNGLSRVDMGPSWGYINKTGEFVWKSKY